jgi:Cu2+-exporting ATPase
VTAAPTGTVDREGPFCCSGCAAAYRLVCGCGLDDYYRRRQLDPDVPPPKPDDDAASVDYASWVRTDEAGEARLALIVEGLHCAACVWLIESLLSRRPGVISARVNMTTRRLVLIWREQETTAEVLAGLINGLGYRVVPYDPALLGRAQHRRERELLRAMAVAGFAFGNVMLLSVSVWAGHSEGMDAVTREFLHWFSALVALPAIAYAGRPFFRSALAVLAHGRTNMDVPISIGVTLAAGMSLAETIRGGPHAYFDAAIGLLFFLLVGRYLESRARGRARSAAEQMLALAARAVTVVADDGTRRVLPPTQVAVGMRAFVAAGERIGVDGVLVEGETEIDTALIDGESLPKRAGPGTAVFAGTLNVGGPILVRATAVGDGTLLAEMARLLEAAEQQKGRYVALADRVARLYAPVVHLAALLTFLGWWLLAGIAWQPALLIAVSVLIITCPCALALAVPAVQVIATGRLMRSGVLVKSGTALERLARAEMVVFDKTGTLTEGRPALTEGEAIDGDAFRLAASLATTSRHPLARALVRAAETAGLRPLAVGGAREVPGYGIALATPDGEIRLGSRSFCGIPEDEEAATAAADAGSGPELWLAQPPLPPVRFAFADALRADAAAVIAALEAHDYDVVLMSGDRAAAVDAVADALAIDDRRARLTPADKVEHLRALAEHDRLTLMVGDGLNDAPALAAAYVSMSPSTAVDLSQTTADLVFQGARLRPVIDALAIARRAAVLVRQNLALALLYNVITVPLAIAGLVTPLIAAIAMSSSSLLVMFNALRLNRGLRSWMSSSI